MDTIPTSDTSKKAGFQTWRVVPSNSSWPWWPFQSTKPHAFAWRGENLDLSHLGWMIFSRWFIWPNGIIFHQLRLLWDKGISLTKPPFGVRSCEVAIIWPDSWGVGKTSNGRPFQCRSWTFSGRKRVVDLYAFLVPLCPQRTRIPVFPQPLQKDQNPYYPCMAYLPTFGWFLW